MRNFAKKVVDSFDVEDIGAKKVFCRCWQSKKVSMHIIYVQMFSFFEFQFPFCDGSHTEHNKVTGDNIGPLIIKKEK